MTMRIQPSRPRDPRFSRRLTDIPVGSSLPPVEELQEEFLGYVDIILGRADPPTDGMPYLDLMEVAAAYYGRAKEVDMLIHWEEQQRHIIRGSPHYKFRTGQLRSFIEMAKMMADLGSRRLTQERLLEDQRYDADG
jgi:hypothetical protein